MGRRLAVSDGTLVQEVTRPVVAVGGVAKDVVRGLVAINGVARQWWPSSAEGTGGSDPRITFTAVALAVIESVLNPATATASIIFTRATGQFTYSNYPLALGTGNFLNPALDGTAGDDDKYLIKLDQLTGDTITGAALATWIDLNAAATVQWDLVRSIDGIASATANISIATDDGAGAPVFGSTVVKAVSFSSERRVAATGSIVWSTLERSLVEIKEGIDADCKLTFNPSGAAIGEADTSGAFTENWHEDAPAVADPENYTVKVTLISGTAPTGPTLAVAHDLDVVREWVLLAGSGDDFSNELDVEVSDGVTPVVKRINMHSQRTAAATSLVFSATPAWSYDDTHTGISAGCHLTSLINGTVGAFITTGVEQKFLEDWHSAAPAAADPENYEVRVDVVSGDGPSTGQPTGVWLNADTERNWSLIRTTTGISSGVWQLAFRRVGQAHIVKSVTVLVDFTEGIEP